MFVNTLLRFFFCFCTEPTNEFCVEPTKLSANLPVITRTAATPIHTPSPVQKQIKQVTEKQTHQVVNSCDLSACLEYERMTDEVRLNDLRFIDSSTHSANSPNRTSICVSSWLIKVILLNIL